MKLDPIPKIGTTRERKRFWDSARLAVLASRKLPGRNVKVDEQQGKGSIISIDDTVVRRNPVGVGACCYDDGTCDVLTEAGCAELGGDYQGNGVPCDPNPCSSGCPCLVALGFTEITLQLSVTVSLLSGTNPCPTCPGTGTLTASKTLPITESCSYGAGALYGDPDSGFDTSGFDCGGCGFDATQTNWQLSVTVDCDSNTLSWSSTGGINFICLGCCGNGCEMPTLSDSGLPIENTSESAGSCTYDCGEGHFQADYTITILFTAPPP